MQDIYELPEETKDIVPQVKRSVANVQNIKKYGYIKFPFPSIRVWYVKKDVCFFKSIIFLDLNIWLWYFATLKNSSM